MANKKNKLNKEQKNLVKKIMKENSPQRRVDKIVKRTKKAMDICKKESQQAKVDEWVEQVKAEQEKAEQEKAEQEKAEKLAIEIWNREANQQTKVDKWVAEELAKMAM